MERLTLLLPFNIIQKIQSLASQNGSKHDDFVEWGTTTNGKFSTLEVYISIYFSLNRPISRFLRMSLGS